MVITTVWEWSLKPMRGESSGIDLVTHKGIELAFRLTRQDEVMRAGAAVQREEKVVLSFRPPVRTVRRRGRPERAGRKAQLRETGQGLSRSVSWVVIHHSKDKA